MITREAIIAEAREWIDTPYHHQASLKGKAADCIGLVVGIANAVGVREASAFQNDVRFRGYTQQPDARMLRDAVSLYLDPTTDPLPGDVILMRFIKEPQHFGILSKPDYMIHSLARAGRVAEHRIDPTWRKRILGFYRFRGLA